MSDDLSTIATWAGALLHKLNPAQRRQVMIKIAQDLRRNQAQRITNQQTPDSISYTPRKQRKKLREKQGRIKRQKAAMFNKLRTTKHLKTRQDAQQLTVGFYGRVARIARVHQEGLKDKVAKNGVDYQYPERQLLGFSPGDHTLIKESLLLHLNND
ncbi:phage virion morphogenesis protein [Solimicrobium silvestre]|uniref:Phage virion morphogenesis protein n=1 Tax=Solimicrobium silvestre TaxID=2099400 RepID=A0A2S9GT28_9BURK|nr:phage virion morphogenesis protein [Solimicrobium silvestre]PRC90874.1 Phage virion morphogenesis protein [Solimicrobium silvestre]